MMEGWIPLFDIFLNSPCAEGDAALWFQTQLHNSPTTPQPTAAFLSLLLSPSSSSSPPLLFIHTLPHAVQCRVLSFLTAERHRFCCNSLRSLATHVLNSNLNLPTSPDQPGFWAYRAACNLLDAVSPSYPSAFEPLQGREEEGLPDRQVQEDFYALPDWLRAHAPTTQPLLPWLPVPPGRLPSKPCRQRNATALPNTSETMDLDNKQPLVPEPESPPLPAPLDACACKRALDLKAELLTCDSTSRAITLSHEIRQICLDSGSVNELTILELIEPWEAEDEIASVLISNLSGESGLVSGHVLCSVALPKLLALQAPASRVLLSATVCLCKLHPTAGVEALIFPLVFRKGGINILICDVLTRIIKECLHPSHISAFCQRLLCSEAKGRRFLCLPCHRNLVSDELVWTEPFFVLFQHILNLDVRLTPDTIDRLVAVIDEMASKFSTSLKFGNFMLCLVTKCARASALHKPSLRRAAEKTHTFVTQPILSKLGGL